MDQRSRSMSLKTIHMFPTKFAHRYFIAPICEKFMNLIDTGFKFGNFNQALSATKVTHASLTPCWGNNAINLKCISMLNLQIHRL